MPQIPYYYNTVYPNNYWNPSNPMLTSQMMQQITQQPQYMINVDGENSAKSWQPQTPIQPNTIIPLFDSDGEHVYFKTYDAYGRMNPLRKGRIVFDDEIQVSETPSEPQYATKEDLDSLKNEIIELLSKRVQNGTNSKKAVSGNE